LLHNVGIEHAGSDITEEESVVTVDVWDFAGQRQYYTNHPLFSSSRAVYILVHDLSKPLQAPAEPSVRQGCCDIPLQNPNNETNLDNLLSWLALINNLPSVEKETEIGGQSKLPYLRPPVFIVGTHADNPVQDIAVMKSQIQRGISGTECGKHVVRPLFNIANAHSNMWNRIKRILRGNYQGIEVLMLGHLTFSVHRQVIMQPESLESRESTTKTKSSFFSVLQTSQAIEL